MPSSCKVSIGVPISLDNALSIAASLLVDIISIPGITDASQDVKNSRTDISWLASRWTPSFSIFLSRGNSNHIIIYGIPCPTFFLNLFVNRSIQIYLNNSKCIEIFESMLLEYGEHHFCFINLKPLTVSPCNETFNSPIDSLAHQCQPPPQKKKPECTLFRSI